MVERVVGDKALPDEVAAQIVAKTDGVPLFVEELTKAVLESGPAQGRGRPLRAGRPAAAARDPLDAARLAARPPRSPRAGQGGRPDRRRDRPRVLPRAARRGRRPARGGAASRARPAGRIRAGLPPRRAARGDLQLQARAGPGRRLRHPAQVPPPTPPRPDRPGAGGAASRRRPKPSPSCSPTTARRRVCVEKAVDYWYKAGRQAMARSAMVEAAAQLTQASVSLAGVPAGP